MGELLETILNNSARPVTTEDCSRMPGAWLGRAHGSAVRDARLGQDACAHGRVHGLVVHELNFWDD